MATATRLGAKAMPCLAQLCPRAFLDFCNRFPAGRGCIPEETTQFRKFVSEKDEDSPSLIVPSVHASCSVHSNLP